MIGLDAITRELERGERLRVASFLGRVDLRGADAQARLGQVDAVEFARIVDQGGIAAARHVGDDRADRGFDVRRGLALHVEKRAKPVGKIGRLGVETKRHERGSCRDRPACRT